VLCNDQLVCEHTTCGAISEVSCTRFSPTPRSATLTFGGRRLLLGLLPPLRRFPHSVRRRDGRLLRATPLLRLRTALRLGGSQPLCRRGGCEQIRSLSLESLSRRAVP